MTKCFSFVFNCIKIWKCAWIRVHTGPGNREKVGDFEQAFSRPGIAGKFGILRDWSGNRREFWIKMTVRQPGGVYHVCKNHVRSPWRHRGWAEHRAKHDNVYLLSAVPLTNSSPDFSHFGDAISRGVTAAIGIAFLLTRLHATSLITLDNNHAGVLSKLFWQLYNDVFIHSIQLLGLLLEC